MERVTNPRDAREGAEAQATAAAARAQGADAGGGGSPRQGISPTARGGSGSMLNRMWESLTGSPRGVATLSSSPPSPGRGMKAPDVWDKGKGNTHFQGADRYDNVAAQHAAGVEPPTVSEMLAPVYLHGRGPPSYESKESYDKGPMVPL